MAVDVVTPSFEPALSGGDDIGIVCVVTSTGDYVNDGGIA